MTGCWALLVAAGSGRRMGLEKNKVLEALCGKTILERSVRAFEGLVDGICLVIRPGDEAEIRGLNLPVRLAYGGQTRQDSVLSGLAALPDEAEYVLVHDAARPLISRRVIEDCIRSVKEKGSGVAAVAVKDTIKVADGEGRVLSTPERSTLRAIQTPQAFEKEALKGAVEKLKEAGVSATDDAGAMEQAGKRVYLVEGDVENIKITTPEDLLLAAQILARREEKRESGMNRIGHGFDVHRLVPERKLILCGVEIPYEKGLLGHSDADVALHALMDALLGAAALKDIGTHFPDTDPRYKGISSVLLLKKVRELLAEKGFSVENVDVTILAQRPKLKGYIDQMQENVAAALGIAVENASVKATTTEGLGFEGEGLGISAHAVALLRG